MAVALRAQFCFVDFNVDPKLSPIQRKHLLTFANDFEDGKWRIEEFEDFVWDNLAETALTQRERKNSILGDRSRLRQAAKNLRLIDKEPNSSRGSEIAEIVLYGLMRQHFGALPVVPKIFYKQNANDYAKGADSVHITVNGSEFSLYFGEAKFYSSIENARLEKVVDSVKHALDTEKLRKENAIITNLRELDELGLEADLLKGIHSALSNRESMDRIKPHLHIPILLLHECDITRNAVQSDPAYIGSLLQEHKERAQAYFEKQITSLAPQVVRYEDITFHLILFPVPSKEQIVDRFLKEAKVLKGA